VIGLTIFGYCMLVILCVTTNVGYTQAVSSVAVHALSHFKLLSLTA